MRNNTGSAFSPAFGAAARLRNMYNLTSPFCAQYSLDHTLPETLAVANAFCVEFCASAAGAIKAPRPAPATMLRRDMLSCGCERVTFFMARTSFPGWTSPNYIANRIIKRAATGRLWQPRQFFDVQPVVRKLLSEFHKDLARLT